MAKTLRKWLITIFASLLAMSMTAFVFGLIGSKPVGVYANDIVSLSDRISSFEMVDGASVRKVSPQGIRFSATIDKAQYDALSTAYAGREIKMGMMIAPLDMVKNKGEFVLSNTALTEGVDYLVVDRKVWATENQSDPTDVYRFNAVLSTLKETNFDRNFVARAFITIGDETAYASSFDPIGRNAVYVALASKCHGETGEQLEEYIAKLQSYDNPVLSVPESVTLFVGETKEIEATINGVKVYPTLSVSNGETGVSVSYNKVKGMSVGSYVVTASVNNGISTLTASVSVTVESNPVLANGTYLSYDSEVADFVLNVPAGRDIKILQLTDTQIIDVTSPAASRLADYEIRKWTDIENNVFVYMDEVVRKANPDFIVITGDIIYGEFDPNAEMLQLLINRMDSYGVYWSIAMGNHDLESACGLDVMLGKYKNSTYCLYANHSDKGYSNYNIEIRQNGEFKKMLYMLDTNDTYNPQHSDPVPQIAGITSEQLNWFEENVKLMKETYGENAESMTFIHVPFKAVIRAFEQYGFVNSSTGYTAIEHIENSPLNHNGDFGCIHSWASLWNTGKDERFWDLLKLANTEGLFLGHCHTINASILYEGIRITFGLKSSTFDEYEEGELGGTLITLNKDSLDMSVEHLYTDLHLMDSHSEGYENQPFVFGNQVKGDILTDVSAGTAKRTLSISNDENYIPDNGSGNYLLVDVDSADGVYMGFGFKFKNVEAGEICFSVDSRYIPVGEGSSLNSVYYWLKDKDGNAIRDNRVKGSVSMGHISMTETFAEAQEEVTLFIQVQTPNTTGTYKMSFDNALCKKTPTAQYGYSEDYSTATIFNQVVYGTATTRITNGSAANDVFDMSIITSGADLPDGATSALKVVKQATGHHYTWVSVVMGSVKSGETYTFSFNFKDIDATNIGTRTVALTSSIDPAKGDSNLINSTSTFSAGKNSFDHTFTSGYDNIVLWIQIAGNAWGDGYSFSLSNINAIKHPTAQYGYSEDYSSAIVFNQVVYGTATTRITNGDELNSAYNLTLTTVQSELPDGSSSALKVSKVNTGHTYTFIGIAMGPVNQGETYTVSFRYKELNGTKIESRHMALSSAMNPRYGGSTYKITDPVTLAEGLNEITCTFTQDYENLVLWMQIVVTDISDTFSFSLSNVKAVKHNYGYSENFENATAYGSTVCGDITVYTKNAGNGVYTATLTSDATELPDGVNKGMKIEKSALSGHTYTYVNFVFGSVKQGETYTFGFNSKVVSASDGFGMCYSLSSSITPDRTAVENFQNTVTINNGGRVSFEWTADKDYDNIAIWVQISNSTWNSGTYSVTFSDVKAVKHLIAQYGYSEDYSTATISNQVVYGTATTRITDGTVTETMFNNSVYVNSMYDLSVTTDQSELPDGSSSALKISKVGDGHTHTFIGIAMGPVSQGETYKVSFKYKEINGTNIDRMQSYTSLIYTMHPRYGTGTYAITNPVQYQEGLNEITCTFTQDYENLVLWIRIVANKSDETDKTSNGFSVTLSDINCAKQA